MLKLLGTSQVLSNVQDNALKKVKLKKLFSGQLAFKCANNVERHHCSNDDLSTSCDSPDLCTVTEPSCINVLFTLSHAIL